jgi:hypothetical protein
MTFKKNKFKFKFLISVVLIISNMSYCKKKTADVEIQDCDVFYNYYKDGSHYIRRDIVTDDGVMDYNKLLEEGKTKNSNCYPAKNQDIEANIELENKNEKRNTLE